MIRALERTQMALITADLSGDLVLIKWGNSPVQGRNNHLVFNNLNTRTVFCHEHRPPGM